MRTMQTPTSTAAMRSGVVIERQEESPRRLRRERARCDSGILGVDDLALVRRSITLSGHYD
jgi:hypothetical protein